MDTAEQRTRGRLQGNLKQRARPGFARLPIDRRHGLSSFMLVE